MESKNKPIETLRDGRIKATIWENQSDRGAYHTVALAKVYEDRDGKLQETSSFSAGELLRVAELAREAHGVIRELRRDRTLEQAPVTDRDQPPSHAASRPRPEFGR